MIITTTLTKHNRINVFADGEYTFTVCSLLWQKSGIREKSDVDADVLASLKAEGEAEDAYEKALSLLTYRAHAAGELYFKLTRKFSVQAAEAAVERCRENRLIDDEAFARDYAEELVRRKNFSDKRIYAALLAKGIDRETAESTVKNLNIDKASGIEKAIEKMRLPEHPDKKQTEKAVRRLLSLGYGYEESRRAVNERAAMCAARFGGAGSE